MDRPRFFVATAAAVLVGAACGGGGTASPDAGPGPVAQRAGVLYEGELWMRPAGGSFGPRACRGRRSLPGCELIKDPFVIASAVDGSRLVVLMSRDFIPDAPAWDLLVSDDLGTTVRRFSLDGVTGNGREGALHLFDGRIFVLASLTDPTLYTVGNARIFEVDPAHGGITPRGGAVAMSSAFGHAASGDGVLTTVAFARASSPQVIGVTRFDPATNVIRRDELGCDDHACALGSNRFISGDGDTFDLLTLPDGGAPGSQGCLVTVRVSAKTVATECLAGLPTEDAVPVSSFGGTPYDFQLATPEGGASWSLVPVTRHWLPSGEPLPLGVAKVFWKGGSFFAYSPPELAVLGDDFLLRLDEGGKMTKTALQHQGCLTVGAAQPPAGCSQAVVVLPLPDDGVLFVTRGDEFQDENQSRILFQVGRSHVPFEDFELSASASP